MSKAKSGSTVKVHYTGKLDDGRVFDSSFEGDPIQFKIGEEKLLPDFEKAVVGMDIGESKTIQIESTNAYGPYHDKLVMPVNRDQLPSELEPKVGQYLETTMKDGQAIVFQVVEVNDASVTLDANHPLAGQDLTFDIQLMEIV
jgi:peptidylprolyl isomerase